MARQREYAVAQLPQSALDAHEDMMANHLSHIRAVLDDELTQALAIVLPPAGSDHDGWRRALAGDLARQYTPVRVNIVSGNAGDDLQATLDYLRDAPGVTGHYVAVHD